MTHRATVGVCSPRLLEADCKTVAEMQLVNALCRFVELAEKPSHF